MKTSKNASLIFRGLWPGSTRSIQEWSDGHGHLGERRERRSPEPTYYDQLMADRVCSAGTNRCPHICEFLEPRFDEASRMLGNKTMKPDQARDALQRDEES